MFSQILNKNYLTSRIEGYTVTRLEIVVLIALLISLFIILKGNLQASANANYDQQAQQAYENIKTQVYSEMSSPKPLKKYLMKNILGPTALPAPLNEVLLGKGVRLNYLIRIAQPARTGRARDQLRFEVTHDDGRHIFRYTEIEGEALEQIVNKTVIDE